MNENNTITVHKLNESYVTLTCNPIIERELGNYFSARANNYRFHPLYKQGFWDGFIRFFDTRENRLPIGLTEELNAFARKGGYEVVSKHKQYNEITREELEKFIETLNLPEKVLPVRDYQFEAAYQAIHRKHLNIGSVTSSGKSLILYIIIRVLEKIKKKVILVVPNVSLVEQMYSDFEEYGWEQVADKCHMIYSGQKKVFDCPVIVSTWQSLYKDKELFKNFHALLIDECHQAKAKSLKEIAESCVNAEYRIGCTGTLPPYHTADWFTISGSTGTMVNFSTYKKLQDDGHIAQLKVYSVILQYNSSFKREVYGKTLKDYAAETDYVNGNPDRCKFILKMVQNLNQNVLVLFTKKEKHGYPLKELFEKELVGKRVIYIDGDVDPKERERLRHQIGSINNAVILATYGTFATGINAPNIHYLIFASGYKSYVKVLQSIGRILRLHESKSRAVLFDLVDDLSFKDKANDIRFVNFAIKHHLERIKIYQAQEFDWKSITYKI